MGRTLHVSVSCKERGRDEGKQDERTPPYVAYMRTKIVHQFPSSLFVFQSLLMTEQQSRSCGLPQNSTVAWGGCPYLQQCPPLKGPATPAEVTPGTPGQGPKDPVGCSHRLREASHVCQNWTWCQCTHTLGAEEEMGLAHDAEKISIFSNAVYPLRIQ